MLRYEDFPKKCLKCRRSDVPLEKFQIGYVKGKLIDGGIFSRTTTSIISSYSTKFPVCRTCKRKFSTFLRLKQLFTVTFLLNFFTLLLFILFTFVPSIPHIKFPFNILPLATTLTVAFIFGILIKINPNNIQDYIVATENGIIIKDRDYEREVDEYKNSKLVDNIFNVNKKYCTNCGYLISSDADFCLSCGKDLRIY
ncbi:MAG: zinc-ribbon domain-containing protein [Promethearchaeota archaeon]